MEISSVQHQAMTSNHLMEEMMLASGGTAGGCQKLDHQQDKKPRPQPEQALKCPRCDSTNTKFCYYNNHSLSQPRYFCKGCRRYWTQGGSLRNVPVGGGCRKNSKRSSSSNSKRQLPHQHQQQQDQNQIPGLPPPSYDSFLLGPNPNPSPAGPGAGFFDILRAGFLDSTSPAGLSNLVSYGFDNGGLLPFDGGLGLNSAVASTAIGFDANNGNNNNNNNNNNNVGVDSGRDYWNGGCNWHGIINSSMM